MGVPVLLLVPAGQVQGGLVFLELENGRLIKTPITNFSLESQQVLRTILPTMPVF